DRTGLLAGLVSRADVVMFPVDCVSHDAVATVKRLCRQASKPYVPLRSAGLSSFVAALSSPEIMARRAGTLMSAVSFQSATQRNGAGHRGPADCRSIYQMEYNVQHE